MEWLLVLIPLLLVSIVAVALVLAYRLHLWNSTYRELAKKYRGQFYTRYLLPQLAFRYGQQACRIENFYRRFFWRRPATRIQLEWPDRDAVLEVTSPQYGSRLWGGFRYTQVCWNEPQLDLNLLTRLGPADQQRGWINSESASRLQQLLNRLQPRDFNLLIRRGRAEVTCGPFQSQKQQVEDLLQLSWQFLDQLKAGQTMGLDFLTAHGTSNSSQTICPVCNQTIAEPVATCMTCRTPHCQECWEYNGGCAKFACGEKRLA